MVHAVPLWTGTQAPISPSRSVMSCWIEGTIQGGVVGATGGFGVPVCLRRN